jgi:BlaI family transcriptional regulator, penicillinase repressor
MSRGSPTTTGQAGTTNISDAEALLMEAFWRHGSMTSGELVDRLAESRPWSPKTVRSLLARLEQKGAVRREGERPHRFLPTLDRDAWLAGHAAALVEAHCDGRLAPLLAAFSRRERISRRDREDILRLLETLK